MPKVGFYLLPSQSERERLLFACKLTEKAYRNGRFAYIMTETDQQSAQLDDLLWTFRQGSFIPHQRHEHALPPQVDCILIGERDAPENWTGIIINLSTRGPAHVEHCERILEILDDTEAIKTPGRMRYQRYKQAGLSIETHTMR